MQPMYKQLTAESWEKINSYFDTFKKIVILPNDYRPDSYVTQVRNELYGELANKRNNLNGAESTICVMLIEAFNFGVQHERNHDSTIAY